MATFLLWADQFWGHNGSRVGDKHQYKQDMLNLGIKPFFKWF